MFRTITTILQIIAIFLPTLNYIFNIGTVTPKTAAINIFIGLVIAFLIEAFWSLRKN